MTALDEVEDRPGGPGAPRATRPTGEVERAGPSGGRGRRSGRRLAPRPVVYWWPFAPPLPAERQVALVRALGRHRPVVVVAQRLTGQPGVRPVVVPGAEPEVVVLEVPRHLDGVARRWPALAGLVKGAAVRAHLWRRGGRWRSPILVLGGPCRADALLMSRRRVLDLHDPPPPGADRDGWAGTVAAVARTSRLVVVSARRLRDVVLDGGADATLLGNATWGAPIPDDEPPRGRVVGYVGALDWRIDLDLLAAVADEVPGVELRLLGRVTDERAAEVAALAARPNVTLLEPRSGAALAEAVEAMAVGLNPVRPSWHTDCMQPTKAFQYAVHGVACASTDVAEARWLPVTVAGDRAAFVAAVAGLLDSPPDRGELRAYGNANTWDARGDELEALLVSAGLG